MLALSKQMEYCRGMFFVSPNVHLINQITSIQEQYDCIPEGSEGYFLIPHWSVISPTYGSATSFIVHQLAKETGKKLNQNPINLFHSNFLLQSRLKENSFTSVQQEQGDSNLIIIPAQFTGAKYRNHTSYEAVTSMAKNEFPLGLYEVCFMLLLHAKNLTEVNIECPGDIITKDAVYIPENIDTNKRLYLHGNTNFVPIVSVTADMLNFTVTSADYLNSETTIASAIFG